VIKYGDITAVDHVSFTAQPGRVTVILGPNGAGKTSTIEACEGFLAPTSGSVQVLGLNPFLQRKQLNRKMGIMLQEGGIYPSARVAELVRQYCSLYGNDADAYSMSKDDLWCIPTAEAPLTSIHAGEVLAEADLPIRYMAHSSCYRREAGSAGRDTRGMLRSHEFDKVEIFSIATPEGAPAMLTELITRVERVIANLGLPYRIIEICTGDMGQSHHRSFDLEVYAPGCDAWLEVSSISWFSDYQARRGDIRMKRTGQKGTEFAHTLNASALAVPRVWAAIMENFRQEDGSVAIPAVLHPYMRGTTVIHPK